MILFFILFIVVLLLLQYKFNEKKEGMKPRDKKTKKGLICYYGGAFRQGGRFSTTQDTETGYDGQYYATQTHLKLTEFIKSNGYDVDTLINTYHSKYENKLSKWYNTYQIVLNTLNKKLNSTDGRDNLISSCIKNIKSLTADNYDFILFIRIDLFLKPGFFDILDITSNKINFIANNYDTNTCMTYNKDKDPVVVDLILFVPKKYFYILDDNFKLCHESWTYYKEIYKLNDRDMNFMTHTIFDSNSYRDMNNYYLMVSRKENTKKHNNIDPWDYNYEKNIYNNKTCTPYKEENEKYLNNPAEMYYKKYINFYDNIE